MRRLAALVIASLLATACSASGAGELMVTATFADVGDLAERAPVYYADIRVGGVEDIRLKGTEALVTMSLDPEADVPEGVTARVRRTSALGERVVDLVPPQALPADAPPLADGATIERTEVRADLEDLVVEGSEIFGAIGASQIATVVDEGAKGFGGKGEELATLVTNLRDITQRYSGETDDIRALVRSLDTFNSELASEADSHRRAVANTARAIDVLERHSGRLEDAIGSLARLATSSRSILDAHVDEMDRFFDQTEVILGVLASEQESIRKLLLYAPRHNRNTQLVEYAEFNQIIQDFVICGFNDNPNDPARRCIGDGE
jgi:phospholipid/cholesterol/gamma-HCH transport system substrate-binding protein